MSFKRVLIANRGEIAIRIARAVAEAGMTAVALYATDDAASLHVKGADEAIALAGSGAKAYLDIAAVTAAAKAANCDAVHPGYGFLSENAAFARALAAAGIAFIGPSPDALEIFGDKSRARALAADLSIPTIQGVDGGATKDDLAAFLMALPDGSAMMVKAVAGGGGRGMRIVRTLPELDSAYDAASREAEAAFGDAALYAERLIEQARHIEVQIAADGERAVAIGERDCSLQRRHQKILEIAPAPGLPPDLRAKLFATSERLAEAVGYRTVGTIEFLIDQASGDFAFIEANARLQVEHTITEEVTGVDLVRAQIALAEGASLADLGLTETPSSQGFAIQARVNLETLSMAGETLPAGGVLSAYEPPSGPGVRVDGYGYAGYVTSPNYDSLLAKVIGRAATFPEAARRTERALKEFRIDGVDTNISLLRALLTDTEVLAGAATTRSIEARASMLMRAAGALPVRQFENAAAGRAMVMETMDGAEAVAAGLQATVGAVDVAVGDLVRPGQQVAVLEAMKMEHVVKAGVGGRVVRIACEKGQVLLKGQPILFIEPQAVEAEAAGAGQEVDPDHIRPDLAEVLARLKLTEAATRPESIARRAKLGFRMARDNVDDLVDPGTFLEYGGLTMARPQDHPEQDIEGFGPGDGIICGIGQVNSALFGADAARCGIFAYDYTVLGGTQGGMNHRKTDRVLQVVDQHRLPVVFYAEGGGGRAGNGGGGSGAAAGANLGGGGNGPLNVSTFVEYARLSGLVPKIAVVNGYCFAGNASVAGMSEFIIATERTNIGMAGPALIEGGGLGVFAPTDIGPAAEQFDIGVIDLMAKDEAHATQLAKQMLSYFQGALPGGAAGDQRALRRMIPENRLRTYDVRPIIETLADTATWMELRRNYAPGIVTGFARIEGRPVGIIASDNTFLGGAVDCDGADKASHMYQVCDAYDLPIMVLLDTPGFMVGPDSERQAAVRKTSRLFVNGAKVGVPILNIVLRKAYGLGAMALAGGTLDKGMFSVAWPTGEFGGMGLEGMARLATRRQVEAEPDPVKQKAIYDNAVARSYASGKALRQAMSLQVDAVIDPADTRAWVLTALKAAARRVDHGPRRPIVDAW